ncbi:protein kinase domain-containing protein [Nakamurella sp.]|uniref:serine/threonine-protein kinase n=1 Tax=Nakamurella sp. TaxID=1869182 RepID=UPI0037833582
MTRPPSPAPTLPGYSPIRHLGGGGFADVFLYRQLSLDREVAVKVLLASDSSPSARARFENEGAVMARLSEEHRNIVPVYDAAICADGRPYLVMQYCPKPDLAKRYKSGSFTVAEVLSTGVQLAGAVESAHRQGILHRDIKPANVLTTRSGRPALTDFGIAVATSAAHDPDAVGVSIPWSPPELLADEPVGDVRSDVYSLAATLYTLLARRSPLEVPDRRNTQADLLSRIPRIPAPPTGRGDTPRSLERLLSRGLAKDPALRFPTAEQLARALQQVQREIGEPITDFEFLAADPGAELADLAPDAADHTRVRPLVVRAQGVTGQEPDSPTRMRGVDGAGPVDAVDPATRARPAGPEHTVRRGPRATGGYLDAPPPSAATTEDTVVPPRPAATAAPPATKRRWVPVAVGVAVLVLAGGLTWIVLRGGTGAPALGAETATASAPTGNALPEAVVPAPTDLTGTVTPAGVVFTWTNPAPQAGDSYSWTRSDPGQAGSAAAVTEPSVTVTGVAQACVEVELVRDDGRYSARPAQACAGG